MKLPLLVLFACMTVSGCVKDEQPVGSASTRDARPPQATSQAAAASADDAGNAYAAAVTADVDCDGAEDTARMEYVEDRVRVTVTFAATKTSQSLEFGLGNSMAQESLCGTEATLDVEGTDYDLTEALGENPEGFRQSKMCKGLRLMDGECDSMHIFWNHDTRHIDWWRL